MRDQQVVTDKGIYLSRMSKPQRSAGSQLLPDLSGKLLENKLSTRHKPRELLREETLSQ